MKVINATGMCLTPAMAIALVEDALSSGVTKSDLKWRMGVAAACSVQILLMVAGPDGLAKTQTEIREYIERGDPDEGIFSRHKKQIDPDFQGIELFAMGGGPVFGRITGLAIPKAVHDMAETE